MGQRQSSQDESKELPSTPEISQPDTDLADERCFSRLLDLPSELLDQILEYLSPVSLAKICQTCKLLNRHGSAERLWKACLEDCTPHNDHSHKPFASWKEMYSVHYPYWFLPKHKIWFSDKTGLSNPLAGQLMLARYDYRIGSIEGYRLVAENTEFDMFFRWTHDTSIPIHVFEPRVGIFIDDPVVKLDQIAYHPGHGRLQQEVKLPRIMFSDQNDFVQSLLFPTTPIPLKHQVPSMALWPPKTIPAPERVRVESPSSFRDSSHKPSTYEQMSTTTFRLRTRFNMNLAFRERWGLSTSPEDVTTFSTILPEYYTPTTEKPYQGIWVGDYSSHGCEFLLIMQSTPEEAQTMTSVEGQENPPRSIVDTFAPTIEPHLPPPSTPDPPGCTGRLDAIKLTGDPNVPRGQPSWIAQDISRTGLVRIAQEPEFRGARVVRSSGHIAQPDFRDDAYTPCHLIMIDEDTLAQYWIVSVIAHTHPLFVPALRKLADETFFWCV
ncbi:MAG: hypothetical protein GOMPHAMPRED_002758 [Gomphillus americanus]|uniref:F-box domain-containing protein n=1 Tax=Gomphillus americanus TaxID=1940652 RepID=A0A8H3FEK8_9LECA|nr:MAG: hypothetical protein GOMPHAMPRED_002758 [Gomphillus americanus]